MLAALHEHELNMLTMFTQFLPTFTFLSGTTQPPLLTNPPQLYPSPPFRMASPPSFNETNKQPLSFLILLDLCGSATLLQILQIWLSPSGASMSSPSGSAHMWLRSSSALLLNSAAPLTLSFYRWQTTDDPKTEESRLKTKHNWMEEACLNRPKHLCC